MTFESVQEVAKWADDNGGESALRTANAAQVFGDGPKVKACISEWLAQQEDSRRLTEYQNNNSLRIREVSAAEASAMSASKSADAAEKALRWAKYSAAAAAASGIAAIVAFFK